MPAAVAIGCAAASFLSLTALAPAGAAAPPGGQAMSHPALATTSSSAGQPKLVLPALGTATAAAMPRGSYGTPPLGWRLALRSSLAPPFQTRSRKARTQWTFAPNARGAIDGTVRLKNRSGRRLPGVCVWLTGLGAAHKVTGHTHTGRRGTFRFSGLPGGRYQVQIGPGCGARGDYIYSRRTVTVRVGRTLTVTLFLLPAARLSGVVTGPDHQALAGICVAIGNAPPTMTDASGSYTFTGLAPGRYHVGFIGGCGNSGSYAPQAYPGSADLVGGAAVRVQVGQSVTGIDAVMQPGGTLTGTLTDSSGHPLSDVCVDPVQLSGPFVSTNMVARLLAAFDSQSGAVETSGSYEIGNMWPGRYDVMFFACGTENLASRWFRTSDGEPVSVWVGSGTVTTGVSAVMGPSGSISGAVTEHGVNEDKNACVVAYPRGGTAAFRALGGTEMFPRKGRYRITGLPAGRYVIRVFKCNRGKFGTQWYPDATGPATARPVPVVTGRVTTGINIAVTAGGFITGRVTSRVTGRPIRDTCVSVLDFDPANPNMQFAVNQVNEVGTERDGGYRIGGMGGKGTYWVAFGCGWSGPAPQVRTGVYVAAPGTTSGVNAALGPAGSLSGRLTIGAANIPAAGVCVTAYPVTGGGIVDISQTGPDGGYVLRGMAQGTYRVLFAACTPGPVPGAPDLAPQAVLARVSAGRMARGVDGRGVPDGSVSGTVTNAGSAPVAGICVTAIPVRAAVPAHRAVPAIRPVLAVTSAAGTYSIGGVVPGRYRVEFASGCGGTGYATQWWQDANSMATATIVTVAPGATTTGISATLAP